MTHSHEHDPACAVAHGSVPSAAERTLVAVFATPVAGCLLRLGAELGFTTYLYDPDPERSLPGAASVRDLAFLDGSADVVLTDHHRAEIGPVLRQVLKTPARWIGIMGSPRHSAPHIQALAELGVPEPEIARVHRPIGLNIGSQTPPEIAVATLAGLLADRNGRPGGFAF
jgi:xanthine dehydrogenase accessory factor